MEVTYGRISQSEILMSVLQSDIEKIKLTMEHIDQNAFETAVDTILNARKIYIVGIRSCATLANFLGFYLNLIRDNVVSVDTNSSSEIFEQIIRITEEDVIIGISFPRYSMRTLKALEFANNRGGKDHHTDGQRSLTDESLFVLQSDRAQRYGFDCGFACGAAECD